MIGPLLVCAAISAFCCVVAYWLGTQRGREEWYAKGWTDGSRKAWEWARAARRGEKR